MSKSSYSTSSPTFGVVSVLESSHSRKCGVVYRFTSVHDFGEVSVQEFCSLFNWVVCFLTVEF